MFKPLGKLAFALITPFQYFFDLCFRTYWVFKSLVLEYRHGRGFPLRNIVLQVYFTGVQALPIMMLAGLVIGAAVIMELAIILPVFGAGKYTERLSVIVLVRELIPIMTALIIIGRSGTAITTELGTMKLNREIELIDRLGINIDYFLVLPRLAGTIIAMLGLIVVFNAVALGGGWLLVKLLGHVTQSLFFGKFISVISSDDIIMSLLKGVVFGWGIAMISCRHGLSVRQSFTEVPQVATAAVVNSIIWCLVTSIFISLYIFTQFNI